MVSHLSVGFRRCLPFLFLLLVTAASPSRCDCAGLPREHATSSRGGRGGSGGGSINRLGKWESSVPTYALNWPQHQGTMEDLVEANLEAIYVEKDVLAGWAATAAFDANREEEEVDYWYAISDDIKHFKSNPCAPGRDCTHYEQAGYVFNSMTL